jgi:hypothetical protein
MLFLIRILGIAGIFFFGNERRIGPRLELDRVRAGRRGSVNQSAAEIHVAVVIGSNLGDDVGGLAQPDFHLSELNGFHVRIFS